LRADRAAQLQCQGMNLLGQVPEPRDVFRLAKVEEWPRVHLSGAGMDQKRSGGLVLLEDLLNAAEILGQGVDRHADVLDERQWLRAAFEPVKAWQGHLAQLPKRVTLFRIACSQRMNRQAFAPAQPLDKRLCRPRCLGWAVGLILD